MDLKNYILEYVSSGRNRRKSGVPVEPDTVLKKGDVVRIKDKEWLETLRSDTTGWRYIDYQKTTISFTPVMAKYIGREVMVITSTVDNSGRVIYEVRLTDGNSTDNNIIGNFVFTNEMLEYI